MRVSVEVRALELKSANVVRRMIQKARLATPESINDLEVELDATYKVEAEKLGSLAEKVKDESQKGIEQGKARAKRIELEREKRGVDIEKPKEFNKELAALVAAFKGRVPALREKAGLDDASKAFTKDGIADAEGLISAAESQVKSFATDCAAVVAKMAPLVKEETLPTAIKREWYALNHEVEAAKLEVGAVIKQARDAVEAVHARERAQKLEEIKSAYREKAKSAKPAVQAVVDVILKLEAKAEPYAKSNDLSEEAMKKLGEELDKDVEKAQVALNSAIREMVLPADEGMDEESVAQLRLIHTSDVKRHQIRLGQMGLRISRVLNLVNRYRRELRMARNVDTALRMKVQILDKIPTFGALVKDADAAVKAVEKRVEPFLKAGTSEDKALVNSTADIVKAIKAARDKVGAAISKLTPIADDLDEDIKMELRKFLAPRIRQPESQLKHMEGRLGRAEVAVTNYRDTVKRNAAIKLMEELKPTFLAKVEAAAASIAALEADVKAAETKLEPIAAVLKLGPEAAASLRDDALSTAVAATTAAQEKIVAARQTLCPVPADADELVKKELEKFAAPKAKEPLALLAKLEERLTKAAAIVTGFRLEAQKPDLMVHVAKATEVVLAADDKVQAAEKSAATFGRSLRIPIADMVKLATANQKTVEAAQAAIELARKASEPPKEDSSLDQGLRQEMAKFVQPLLKLPRHRCTLLGRRTDRCARLLEQYRRDIERRKEMDRLEAKKAVIQAMRSYATTKALTPEALFEKIGTGPVDRVKFVVFFTKELPGVKAIGETFDSSCVGKTMEKGVFVKLLTPTMEVLKSTTLGDGISLASTTLRTLQVGELLEVLEGPTKEEQANVMRVRVKGTKDGVEGWATIAGNAGTVFLKEVAA